MDEEISKPKAPYDPGWNDPPLFSYDSHQSAGRTVSLNRRISFTSLPTGDIAASPPRTGSVCGSPPCTGPPPLAPTKSVLTVSQSALTTEPCSSPQPISLPLLLENFNSSLIEIFSDGNEKETNEIKRRLIMMETMWNENKFPNDVQLKLLQISEALKYGKLDEADSLQRGLMVDHTPLCRTWMAAIRLLINSKRSLSSN